LAIVVVGGSTKDIGKTALVCAVIAALPEFAWTAVKITGHEYDPPKFEASRSEFKKTIWEETSAGSATDTARYLAAGARRALLVTRFGEEIPAEDIWRPVGEDRNIIFESNRILDVVKADVCLALTGGVPTEMKPSFMRMLRGTDALVSVGDMSISGLPTGVPRFRLQSLGRLSPELVEWLRRRLPASA
jgi:hypothetical protein